MQPFPKQPSGGLTKIGDVVVNPSQVKIDPNLFINLTCGGQLSTGLGDLNTKPASATVAILPHTDSQFNGTALPDTPTTFKALDDAVKAQAKNWNITLPAKIFAYALFSKAVFLDEERDAILFLTKGKTHQLYLKAPGGEHVWFSDLKVVYCKKQKLFVLDSDGYSMYIDLGI